MRQTDFILIQTWFILKRSSSYYDLSSLTLAGIFTRGFPTWTSKGCKMTGVVLPEHHKDFATNGGSGCMLGFKRDVIRKLSLVVLYWSWDDFFWCATICSEREEWWWTVYGRLGGRRQCTVSLDEGEWASRGLTIYREVKYYSADEDDTWSRGRKNIMLRCV